MYDMDYRSPIFVTGCPRSGTSLYCGCLDRSGANGGEICGATQANPKGQYENSVIRNQVLKPLLREMDADPLGQKPLPDPEKVETFDKSNLRQLVYDTLINQGLQEDEIWYIKVCKATLVWPVFNRHFPDARWIIVRRDKEDIVNSCIKTGFMRKRTSKNSWRDWVDHHVARFEEMKNTCPDRVMEVWPTELINGNFDNIKYSIEWLGLKWNEDVILDWVDKKIWHGK